MSTVSFRFYEELNDFLPAARRKIQFSYSFRGNPSVKDAIEAIGVPHVEVDMILANGESTDFSYKIKDGDTFSVYPVFESLNIVPVTHLKGRPLRITRFICDVHLGKLARYLRLFGFDTYFRGDLDDNEIIDISILEKRIILTRDTGLLKNKKVTHGYRIRSVDAPDQLKEICIRLDLKRSINPFTLCMECNGKLEDVSKSEIRDRLLPLTKRYYRKFKRCSNCDRVYWNGSHYKRMNNLIKKTIRSI